MKIKRIHVNQHNIRYNKKYTNGDFTQTKPVITVKTYKENIKGDTVQINGASTVVYKPIILFHVVQKFGLKHTQKFVFIIWNHDQEKIILIRLF